jgi:hypothetical protein
LFQWFAGACSNAAQEKLVMKTQKKPPIEEKDDQGRRKPIPLEEKFEFLKNAPVQGKYDSMWYLQTRNTA